MIVLLGVLAVISHTNLTTSSDSFDMYNRRAHLNVYLSDIRKDVYVQAYTVEIFLQGQGDDNIDFALSSLTTASGLVDRPGIRAFSRTHCRF